MATRGRIAKAKGCGERLLSSESESLLAMPGEIQVVNGLISDVSLFI